MHFFERLSTNQYNDETMHICTVIKDKIQSWKRVPDKKRSKGKRGITECCLLFAGLFRRGIVYEMERLLLECYGFSKAYQ